MGKDFKVVEAVAEYCYYTATTISKTKVGIGQFINMKNSPAVKWRIDATSLFDIKDKNKNPISSVKEVVSSDEFDHNPTAQEMADFANKFSSNLAQYILDIKKKYTDYSPK